MLYSSFQSFCKLSTKSHYKNSFDHTHNSLFVGMVSQTFLKLSISLPSVDKIHPVVIVQTAYFHCASSVRCLGRQTVLQLSDMRANAFLAVTLCLEERMSEHIKPLHTTALKPCTELVDLRNYMYVCVYVCTYVCSLSQMFLALLHVNTSSTTDLLRCMQKCLQLWRHLVVTWLVPSAAVVVHLQAVQGNFEIHQLCLPGNGHSKALKSAISIYAFHRVTTTVPTHTHTHTHTHTYIYIYIYIYRRSLCKSYIS